MSSIYQTHQINETSIEQDFTTDRYLSSKINRKLCSSQLEHSYTTDRPLKIPKSLKSSLERASVEPPCIDYEAEISKNNTSKLIFDKLSILTNKHKLKRSLKSSESYKFSMKANKLNQKYINTLK